MSHDATYILRHGESEEYFYSHWGGLAVDRDLLQGPDTFMNFVYGLRRTDEPCLGRWLTGLVVVDVANHTLQYWAWDHFGNDPLGRRIYPRLLAKQWPGWTCSWLSRPGALMGRTERWQPEDPDAVRAWQSQSWKEAVKEDQWLDAIADYGADLVRTWVEDDHNSWVTVTTDGGTRDDRWLAGSPAGSNMTAGPDAVLGAMEDRPERPFETLGLEFVAFDACYHLDLTSRTFWWWLARPPWPEDPHSSYERTWPDWTVRRLEGGPWQQMRATERDPKLLLSEERLDRMLETLERVLGPRTRGGDILSTVVKNMEKDPDDRIVVTSPGPGDEGPRATTHWRASIREHFERLLAREEFQLPEAR